MEDLIQVLKELDPPSEHVLSRLRDILHKLASGASYIAELSSTRDLFNSYWMPNVSKLKNSPSELIKADCIRCYSLFLKLLGSGVQESDYKTLAMIMQSDVFQSSTNAQAFLESFTLMDYPISLHYLALIAQAVLSNSQFLIDRIDAAACISPIVDISLSTTSSATIKTVTSALALLEGCILSRDAANIVVDNVKKLIDAALNVMDAESDSSIRNIARVASSLLVLIDLHYWEPILDQFWIHSVPAMLELPPDQFTMILSQQNNCILLLDEIHRSVLHESTAPQVAADRVAILSRCDSALLRSLIPAAPMISLSDDKAYNAPIYNQHMNRLKQLSPFVCSALELISRLRGQDISFDLKTLLSVLSSWSAPGAPCNSWTTELIRQVASKMLSVILDESVEQELLSAAASGPFSCFIDESTQFAVFWHLHDVLLSSSAAISIPLINACCNACLHLMQDYRTHSRTLALDLTSKLLRLTNGKISAKTAFSLIEAIMKSLVVRTKDFISNCLSLVIELLSSLSDEDLQLPSVQNTVMESIIYELTYLDNISILTVYASHLSAIIAKFGLDLLYYTQPLIPKLLWMLDTKSEPLVLATSDSLRTLISYCWPRMDAHAKKIFGSAVFVYIEHLDNELESDDEETMQSNKRVRASLIQLLCILKDATPSQQWKLLIAELDGLEELVELVGILNSHTCIPNPYPAPQPVKLADVETARREEEEVRSAAASSPGSNLRSIGRSGLSLQNLILNTDVASPGTASSFLGGGGGLRQPNLGSAKGPLIQIIH